MSLIKPLVIKDIPMYITQNNRRSPILLLLLMLIFFVLYLNLPTSNADNIAAVTETGIESNDSSTYVLYFQVRFDALQGYDHILTEEHITSVCKGKQTSQYEDMIPTSTATVDTTHLSAENILSSYGSQSFIDNTGHQNASNNAAMTTTVSSPLSKKSSSVKPSIAFSHTDYYTNASTREVFITLHGKNVANRMNISYATTDGTASAGIDYTSSSGVVTFNDGDTQKSFTIFVNNSITKNKYFYVNLSSDVSNSIADNDATVTIISDNTINSKLVNITDFGAVGDGITDNTWAIQHSIDTASAIGGGKVIIPRATYVSGIIYLSSDVFLQSDGGTLYLKNNTSQSEPLWIVSGFITMSGISNTGILGNLTIDGNKNNQGNNTHIGNKLSGIAILNKTMDVLIDNLTVQNVTQDGVYINSNISRDTNIIANKLYLYTNCRNGLTIEAINGGYFGYIESAYTNSADMAHDPWHGIDIEPYSPRYVSKNVTLDTVVTHDNRGDGVQISLRTPRGSGIYDSQRNFTINNITSYNNKYGIFIAGASDLKILGGDIYNNRFVGIQLSTWEYQTYDMWFEYILFDSIYTHNNHKSGIEYYSNYSHSSHDLTFNNITSYDNWITPYGDIKFNTKNAITYNVLMTNITIYNSTNAMTKGIAFYDKKNNNVTFIGDIWGYKTVPYSYTGTNGTFILKS